MKKPTIKEKYAFLLSKLKIESVDLWENDAMIALPERLYFQFSKTEDASDINKAVEAAMMTEKI